MEHLSPPPDSDLSADDLLVFTRVAELGSLSRAAEHLGMPKSTVSRRLAGLERRLGERLLLRTTRRQTLTEFGQLLLEHARRIAAEVDAVKAMGEQRRATPSGRLRVSMPADVANLVLADSLAAFMAIHPLIDLELDLSPRRVDLIAEGFDVAVRIGDLPDDAYLSARRLAVFENALYAAPHYIAEHGEPRRPESLLQHQAVRLTAPAGAAPVWRLRQGMQRWEGSPPARASANSPELLLHLACAGSGIAALPTLFAAPALHAGRLRRVLPGWELPAHTAWAVFPGRNLLPPKTQVFMHMLQTALATAAPPSSPGT